MNDIAVRLRDLALDYPDKPYLIEAAAEIERLQARDALWDQANEDNVETIKRLRDQLHFANVACDMGIAESATEIERLRDEASLWEERTKMGAKIIEESVDEIEQLRDLIQTLIDNDPNEPIADNGMTVLDQWRKDATAALTLKDKR